MKTLADFPISDHWKPVNADHIQLYSFPTPNGVKVSITLEELGLPYDAHTVSIMKDDQKTDAFLSLNPNGKIPAIVDPNGPGGEAIGLFESGAIMIYLAEKTGQLMPADPARRLETIQWLMFQMGGVGPMFGQFGHFYKFAADKVSDKYGENRYGDESRRLLGVLEERLKTRQWIMDDDYTIADIAIFPWIGTLSVFYGAEEHLKLNEFPSVLAWYERCMERPASEKGLTQPPRE